MCAQKATIKKSALSRAQGRLCPKKKAVPPKLPRAIKECSTTEQLLDLLFRTDVVKNEAILDAFDQRMDELDCPF